MKKTFTVAAAVAACFALGACGSSDSGDDGGGGSASTGASTTAADTSGMRVAYASALDPNDIADQLGLEKAGAKVDTLTDDSAVVAGLLRDNIDVGNVDFDAAVKARASGVPIKVIGIAQTKPEYVFVSRPEISSFQQLAGKKVGYHAKGSQTDIFVNQLVKQQAPDIYDDVDFLALEESSRRAQAMEARRLDASALEAINLAALKLEGDYHELGTWASLRGDAQDIVGTAWVTTEDKAGSDRAQLVRLLSDLQSGYDEFYTDKQAWLDMAREKVPDVDQALLPEVYESYKRQAMYPRRGTAAMTPEAFSVNEQFFRDLGEWEDEQPDELVDYGILDAGAGVSGR
ncbi:ABC transporter substrate-binding protein [Conexibacter sp. CPCC 206217]|uniref:ABC transporter substrate-binding protein n=1 Tax=Conexibacter sp. CPCC 206217 TaxID=3064574 RepID=UPI00271DE7D7|nr:ABC transporter substrate-binding protein [Conexibacter sp. CPCC 206217]MDO8212525.1 ABC transporter substrate-binding protein [Conexibacter sp. CPCC 206217]